MKKHYVVAGIVIIAFVVLGASSFKNVMTNYVENFAEVPKSTRSIIQVPGDVIKDKTTYRRDDGTLVFYMKDPRGKEMRFTYKGVKPANFDQANRVVAIGRYKDGAFKADQLLVKCPSKYQNK